ncbi:MAG: ATP-dependent helicase [Desulfovibrio sp.]|nr:ATP-dependent helicase [Desulfovibrio sp.]
MQEEDVRSKAEAVQILTLHAAKGLEYRAAFIPCLEEGILPCTAQFLGYDEGKNVNYAEEKRLFYVGITRATELLYLSCSETRNIYGKQLHLPVSPFFTSIAHFFQKSRIQVEKKTKQTQGSLFSL